jgi:hypothetical protein
MKKYITLLKIGKREYLESLRNEGNLYCNSLGFFSGLEDHAYRGDELEGVTFIRNMDGGTVRFKDVAAPDSEYCEPINIYSGKILQYVEEPGNVFSLYSILMNEDELKKDHIVNDETKKLGEYFLIITRFNEFLERIKAKLEELDLKYRYDLVTYKDLSQFSGRKTLFEKDIRFKHQQEFRIHIHGSGENVLQIKIGSIVDISEIGCFTDTDTFNFFSLD